MGSNSELSTPNLQTEKYCPQCKVFRPKTEFRRDASKKDGLSRLCKPHLKAYHRAYYAEDEVQRIKQRARVSMTRHQWYRASPAKQRAWYAWSTAKRMNRVPKWARFKDTITFYEAAIQLGPEYEVDHIFPYRGETVCGLHCRENLQVLHRLRNQKKGNKMPSEAQTKLKQAQALLKRY